MLQSFRYLGENKNFPLYTSCMCVRHMKHAIRRQAKNYHGSDHSTVVSATLVAIHAAESLSPNPAKHLRHEHIFRPPFGRSTMACQGGKGAHSYQIGGMVWFFQCEGIRLRSFRRLQVTMSMLVSTASLCTMTSTTVLTAELLERALDCLGGSYRISAS